MKFTNATFELLEHLLREPGGMTGGDLAINYHGMARDNVRRMLDRAEDAGMVEIIEQGKHAPLYVLTGKGTAAVRRWIKDGREHTRKAESATADEIVRLAASTQPRSVFDLARVSAAQQQ